MALDSYFQTLKLKTGACDFYLVQDRAVRRRPTPAMEQEDDLRNTFRKSASKKFTMDECDLAPLLLPTRQSSSLGTLSSDEHELPSIDSMNALDIDDDSTSRSWGSDHHKIVSDKTVDSRWSSSSSPFMKQDNRILSPAQGRRS